MVSVSNSDGKITKKTAINKFKPSWGSEFLQAQTSTQNDSDPAPKTSDNSAEHQAPPAASAPLRPETLPRHLKIELWSSKLVKSGKETRIQEDRALGVFEIQHVLDKRIKPGLFLARREPKSSDPTYRESFILVPFHMETKEQQGLGTKTVKLGLVSSPSHLQKAMADCFHLLDSGGRKTQVMVKVMVNKKPKKSKQEKLSGDMLARNPHAWPDVIAKSMPKGTVYKDVMINHEEGVVSWVMEREQQASERGI